MGETCENILRVKAHSVDAEKQLNQFIYTSRINNEMFGLEGVPLSLPEWKVDDWATKIKIRKETAKWIMDNWGEYMRATPCINYNYSNFFCICLFTKNEPPIEWLVNESKDYPDLRFSLDWEIPYGGPFGLCDIVNGSIIRYDKNFIYQL